jgi:hypothetical protein
MACPVGGDRLDTKNFLASPKKLDLLIKNKLIEKQQWRDLALGITANMEGERVQSSGSQQKMADAIVKCIDMEAEIDRLVDKFIDKKKEVVQVIEQVESPIEYDVLHKIYIQYMTLQEVADHYGKEYGWATTTHGRALKSVQEIRERVSNDAHRVD